MLLFHRELGGGEESAEPLIESAASFERCGSGAPTGRRPLLILHGLLGSSRNWQTVGRDFSAAAQVFALDLRNHGQSPHAEPMDYPTMAGDVLAWLEAQAIAGPVDLLGHSMGGRVAMWLACHHPERVRRLIVVDTVPRDYEWPGGRPEFAAMRALDLHTLGSRAEAEAQMATQVPDLGMRKFLTTNLERDTAAGGWRWSINLPVITAALPTLEANPLRPGERFLGAAQFIVCGRSSYVHEADHATIRQHFPAAQITRLADSGHNPHIEARADFVRAVLGILE